jgi:putative ABC transport system ATP-binding protein
MSLLVKIQNLKFSWDNRTPLLNISCFEIKAGERVFIYGPSGSGKSTFLNLIAGVLNYSQGSIRILGTDLKNLSASQRDVFRGHHMGFIFQQFNLIPYLNVQENIELPLKFSSKRKNKIQNIKEEILRLCTSLGIESLLERMPSQLSVGQQQRVAAVRALIGSPEIIIADEPTSALDQDFRDQFLELLLKEASSSSVLFVSHDRTLEKHFTKTLNIQIFAGGL